MLARNGTYWRMLAFSFLHISFIGTIALVVLYGSIKFFHLKIALGLALGESWPLLAQPQKDTDVHKGMLLWESFPTQTCKITSGENNNVNSWVKFKLLYDNSFAPALGGACPMGTNTMALIQTFQAIMTVQTRLSFSAQLTNYNVGPCWHVMGHIGACWHSAFSTFHSLGQQL